MKIFSKYLQFNIWAFVFNLCRCTFGSTTRPTCYHTGEFHIAGLWYCLWLDCSLKTWLSLFCQLRYDSTKCTPEHGKPYKSIFNSQGILDFKTFLKPFSIGVTTNHDYIYRLNMGMWGVGFWGSWFYLAMALGRLCSCNIKYLHSM